MAKVKICNSDFEEIETNITNAKDAMTSLMDDVWQVNFENLYYN